jgi:crossover junction endodeoxyribonuclease RusA
MTDEGHAQKEDYQWQIKEQWRRPELTGGVMLTIYIYFKDHRRRDLDNAMKILLDSMSHMVYKDDSQIQSLCIHKRIDEHNPRVDIDVQECPEPDGLGPYSGFKKRTGSVARA